VLVYNVLGIQEFTAEAESAIPSGTHQVRMEVAYDGDGLGKGGDVTLYHAEPLWCSGRVDATQPMVLSADETTDVGYEAGTPVMSGYTGDDDHDHFIDPEERYRIAMATQ
jgi:hypothetical protein